MAKEVCPSIEILAGGFIVWLTGLSGAGKTAIARAVASSIRHERPVEVLDGDEIRKTLSSDLGFSKRDRDTHVRRLAFVACLLGRNGVATIVAAISPYAEARAEARRLAADHGVPFLEVYVQAEVSVLAARDTKGLYRKALAGELKNLTGVSDPYEAPLHPDLVLRTDVERVAESADCLLSTLRAHHLVQQGGRSHAGRP